MDSNSTHAASDSTGDPIVDRIMTAMDGGPEEQAQDVPTTEPADDEVSEQEEPEQPEQGSEETVDLASLFGIDDSQISVDDSGTIRISTKVDGITAQVTLPELVKGYQLNKSVTQRSQALAEERKAFSEQQRYAQEVVEQRLQYLDAASRMAGEDLQRDYRSIDWEQMRQVDPAEWTAKRAEFADRASRLQQYQHLVAQERQQQLAQQRQREDEYLREQYSLMLESNPRWQDQEILRREMSEIRDAFKRFGFSDADLDEVKDARVIEAGKILASYFKGKSVVEQKRVAVPRLQKPGKPKPSASQARRQGREAIRRSGGSLDSVAAYLETKFL